MRKTWYCQRHHIARPLASQAVVVLNVQAGAGGERDCVRISQRRLNGAEVRRACSVNMIAIIGSPHLPRLTGPAAILAAEEQAGATDIRGLPPHEPCDAVEDSCSLCSRERE